MSALPRPDLPPGPQRDLVVALHELHHRDGWRSLRALARETGVSHTTVSKAFSSGTLPSWGVLELLVEAMGGDPATFHGWWMAASAPAADDGRPTAAIAGRRAELDVVRRHLQAGHGLLLVTGEAGMGKTTVLEAASAQVRDSVLLASGRCLPLSSEVPLLPVAEALRQVDRAEDGQLVARALRVCPDYVREALATVLPEWSTDAPPADPDDRWLRQRLFSGVAELCRALSTEQPFALVLEDLHWADELTLDVVEHLVRHTGSSVLGSWRTDDPEVAARHREWFGRMRRDAAVLPLGPLTEGETVDQVRSIRPLATGDDASRIHARSLGQPLFTEQLVHAGAGEPTFLDDLLDDRVAPLVGPPWAVVSVLGIADRPLTEGEIARAAGLEADRLADALRRLLAQRILDVDSGGVQLRHPLLAEAVRRRMIPGEAAAAHRAVAVTMAAGDEPEPAEVARHWQEAGDHDEELHWQVRAARAAEERYAGAQSAEHWRRAHALWPPDAAEVGSPPVRRHEVVAGIASQLDLAGRPREAVPLLESELALPDPPQLFDVAERADLLRQLARLRSSQFVAGDVGLRLVEQAIALYRGLPPSAGLAAALLWHGNELEWHGRRDEATATLEEAVHVAATAGDRPLERSVRAQWAWQLAASGDDRGVEEIEHVIREFGHDGHPSGNLYVAVRHTDILLMACRPAEDVALAAAAALQQAATWRIRSGGAEAVKVNVSQAWRRAGMVGRAMEAVAADTAAEEPATVSLLHVERAILEVLLGRRDAVARRLDRFERRGGVVDPFSLEAHLHHVIWWGDPAEGLELAETVLVGRHDEVAPGIAGELLAIVTRAAADATAADPTAERTGVARRVDGLRAAMHHDPFAPDAVLADRAALPQWQAEKQRLLGRDTIETWAEAAATWHDLDRPHDEAYCQWRAAEVALRDGHGTVAARLLRQAAARAREHVPLAQAIARTATGTR
ncbi:AAA family ATPase [Nocardioides sp. STR2]|uniref:AAA family ATPase n=1 Tax=Nocardioides pini TaxID=2975053 RepID=A0ABT4CDN8_9ACTN|nr:helix-turn-helix domain-containing protein [Nocardioides pini]MCY4727083.1 AAA family ATPase [Nocardioides pini]